MKSSEELSPREEQWVSTLMRRWRSNMVLSKFTWGWRIRRSNLTRYSSMRLLDGMSSLRMLRRQLSKAGIFQSLETWFLMKMQCLIEMQHISMNQHQLKATNMKCQISLAWKTSENEEGSTIISSPSLEKFFLPVSKHQPEAWPDWLPIWRIRDNLMAKEF